MYVSMIVRVLQDTMQCEVLLSDTQRVDRQLFSSEEDAIECLTTIYRNFKNGVTGQPRPDTTEGRRISRTERGLRERNPGGGWGFTR